VSDQLVEEKVGRGNCYGDINLRKV